MRKFDECRVLGIVRPKQECAGACRRDAAYSVDRIKAQWPRPTRRQMLKLEAKLKELCRAINELPPNYRYYLFDSLLPEPNEATNATSLPNSFTDMLTAVLSPVTKLANSGEHENGGRARGVSARRKQIAAQEAFDLLLYWGERAPTLTQDGDYYGLTAALFEIATGKPAGDVERACKLVVNDMRKLGYRATNRSQYRRSMASFRVLR